jgi:uncharacterized protein
MSVESDPAAPASPVSSRVRVHRKPERGRYDRASIDAILDEALICHVGFEVDGQPYVIPTIHARVDDVLYLHGSPASRMVRSIGSGIPICVTATIVDGLVLARSVFDHSINYRSAVVLGRAVEVTEVEEKMEGFRAVVEHIAPARWDEARRPTTSELNQTSVLRLPIDEASAKVRTGPPKDEEGDYALPVWAGVLPLSLAPGEAWDDPELSPGIPRPDWLTSYRRGDPSG